MLTPVVYARNFQQRHSGAQADESRTRVAIMTSVRRSQPALRSALLEFLGVDQPE